MGEVKIKSGNLVESYVADNNKNRYIAVLYAEADLKPNTTYTIALTINEGYDVYLNEKVFSNWSAFTGDGTYQVFALTTRSDLTKNNNTYTSGKGWWILKNNKYQANFINVSDFQILEGTYTLETIPEYQPYFFNRPAHRYTNGQWVDIPTHHYTNGRWQGELTSQSPLKFWADGNMLDWRVEGRTSGNLISNWEYGDIDANGNPVDATYSMRTGYIPIEVNKIYSISREITTGYWKVRIYDINKTYIGSGTGNIELLWNIGGLTPANPMQNGTSFTKIKPIAVNGYFMRFVCNDVNFSENAMMVEGDYTPSTIPEYEAYGSVGDWDETTQRYKIPVTVNGVTTNLYTDHQLMDGDSIDYATTQTAIPIATGNNMLTVDTAVQPKSVFVKFWG